jgi:hypothetical protein
VRRVTVVVMDEDAEHTVEVRPVEDQEPVETLGSGSADDLVSFASEDVRGAITRVGCGCRKLNSVSQSELLAQWVPLECDELGFRHPQGTNRDLCERGSCRLTPASESLVSRGFFIEEQLPA